MSPISDSARVSLFVADYAAPDAIQKLNIIGAGWAVTGVNPETGLTAPHAVVAFIDVPPDHYGEDFAFTLTLRGPDGQPVRVPGPTGQVEPLRIAQTLRAEEPQFPPEVNVPRRTVWSHTQVALNMSNGIPVQVGSLYTWTLDIDGNTRPAWAVSFYVPGPRPGPVFGGPAGPATIPDVQV
ncbi:hypothetical protein N866_18830 [Actinotalea ferrariae CF5-4]|uniref:Uncharacterized protein n=1 Tax=Actinotalea ferrariae CF5-4 TaxID=948458 RepID=A0A021VV35_9CELL|nr:hypothetical protein [Actinotalea ferrariae]EYR65026.1 hypothetical protein N866_18830 [Actinotalea ferrariae CF5-4]